MTIPYWLTVLSWCSLGLAGVVAVWLTVDIAAGRRPSMRIINISWSGVARYFGPPAPGVYFRFGLASLRGAAVPRAKPCWDNGVVSAAPSGSGVPPVQDAGRHGYRVYYDVSGQLWAYPGRHQARNVTA